MGIKVDCFAYLEKKKECKALQELVCKEKKCSFYMTNEQYRDKMIKVAQKNN